MDLLTLVRDAEAAGLTFSFDPNGRLLIEGPRNQEAIARRLGEHKIALKALYLASTSEFCGEQTSFVASFVANPTSVSKPKIRGELSFVDFVDFVAVVERERGTEKGEGDLPPICFADLLAPGFRIVNPSNPFDAPGSTRLLTHPGVSNEHKAQLRERMGKPISLAFKG